MATPTTLPASFVAGNVLTAAQMNNLRGAFRILQVVGATHATQASSTSTTLADTGLTASITPSATSSKILVIVTQNGIAKNQTASCNLTLLRGSTNIADFGKLVGNNGASGDNYVGSVCHVELDSPNTTSATTYKTQFSRSGTGEAFVQVQSTESGILLMEVSA